MRIAIIGGGAAGLATAWLLEKNHEVTLFEKQPRLGGHADTVEIEVDGKTTSIEAGFEFFSDTMFPNFNRLLGLLEVPIHRYAASVTLYKADQHHFRLLPPYAREQIVCSAYSPRALLDLLRFQRLLSRAALLIEHADPFITVEDYLNSLNLAEDFLNGFVYPFLLAEWCVELDDFKSFSAYNALKYAVMNPQQGFPPRIFLNEVSGGLQTYIQALAKQLNRTQVVLDSAVESVTFENSRYLIHDARNGLLEFDGLIVATHAIEARQLLNSVSIADKICAELGRIEYFKTVIAVHGDRRLMPAHEKYWSVVNTRYDGHHSSNTIWKKWKSQTPIFRSWITYDPEPPSQLYLTRTYMHGKINLEYFRAQQNLNVLNGQHQLWVAGVFMHDIDCHESALMSAVKIAQKLDPTSENLHRLVLGTDLSSKNEVSS